MQIDFMKIFVPVGVFYQVFCKLIYGQYVYYLPTTTYFPNSTLVSSLTMVFHLQNTKYLFTTLTMASTWNIFCLERGLIKLKSFLVQCFKARPFKIVQKSKLQVMQVIMKLLKCLFMLWKIKDSLNIYMNNMREKETNP